LFAPHICMVLFFTHIPFVVNHTINATPPERLQQQTHRDVSIVHCVRTYIIVYSTPYRLFLFVAENRLTYSSRTWNDLQVQKQKTHRKSLVMKRLFVNARSCSEPQRISKLLISTCKLYYISVFTDK